MAYNRNYGPDGRLIPSESNEYVSIFDVSTEPPVLQQVLQIPNTFHGIAWSPAGDRFVVSGGPNDNIHIYDHASGEWAESFAVSLRHSVGLGLGVGPQSAGLAITQSGNWGGGGEFRERLCEHRRPRTAGCLRGGAAPWKDRSAAKRRTRRRVPVLGYDQGR